jgi:hypothetical protein
MEPMNTTARYTADKCEVWVPTQDGEASFAAVLAASGLPAGKCEVYKTSAAGSAGAAQALAERTFLTVYGSPALQSAVGIDPAGTHPLRRAPKNPLHAELLRDRVAELKSRIPAGGLREAVIRGLLYAGMTRATIDERGFEAMRRIRETHGDLPLPAFKAAGTRAIQHAAHRSGSGTRRPSLDASVRSRDSAHGVRSYQTGAFCPRGDVCAGPEQIE